MKIRKNIFQDIEPSKRGKVCWCGEEKLRPFSPAYRLCPNCATLVLKRWPDESAFKVEDDETALYGKNYFTTHVGECYGQISLEERAQKDISERCLYWLKTLMKYKAPPGSVLELGAGHGGFVALCKWAGFDATGLEMSPWVVEFAKNAFGVPMLTGPIEEQDIEKESLDAIALMDVLEHLPTPVTTMRSCLSLLKRDGLLLIQTPRYREGTTYEDIITSGNRFVEQFKESEHLYLYSKKALEIFFSIIGAGEIHFKRAYYDFYDQYLVVGKGGLVERNHNELSSVGSTPSSRLIQALLDLDSRSEEFQDQLQVAEADRAKRLEVIERQGEELGSITGERNRLSTILKEKEDQLAAIEADSAERLRMLNEAVAKLGETSGECNRLKSILEEKTQSLEIVEQDRKQRLELMEKYAKEYGESEGERNRLAALLREKEVQLLSAENDRAARLRIIEEQGQRLGELEGKHNQLKTLYDSVQSQFENAERDREARLSVIHEQGERLGRLEAEVVSLQNRVTSLKERIAEHQKYAEALREQLRVVGIQLRAIQSGLTIAQSSLPLRLFGGWGTNTKIQQAIELAFEKQDLDSSRDSKRPE